MFQEAINSIRSLTMTGFKKVSRDAIKLIFFEYFCTYKVKIELLSVLCGRFIREVESFNMIFDDRMKVDPIRYRIVQVVPDNLQNDIVVGLKSLRLLGTLPQYAILLVFEVDMYHNFVISQII